VARFVFCVVLALLVALACFVLLPTFILFLVYAVPAEKGSEILWTLVFAGPLTILILTSISVVVGIATFRLAEAKVPDDGGSSMQKAAILLVLSAIIVVPLIAAWPYIFGW
jgi:hypothetical protein